MVHHQNYNEHIQSHIRHVLSFSYPLNSTYTNTFDGVNPSLLSTIPVDFNGVSFSNLFNVSHSFPLSLSQTLGFHYDDTMYNDYETNLQLADLIGKVEVGVSDINIVSKIIEKDNIDNDTICPICMDCIKQTENPCRELICNHIYCDGCITKWLDKNKKCPVCNVDLEEKYLQTAL